jgi:hypothetical protein
MSDWHGRNGAATARNLLRLAWLMIEAGKREAGKRANSAEPRDHS